MNNVFKGINVGPVSTKTKIRNFMEKLEINATAITVQNETKKAFYNGIDFICGIVAHNILFFRMKYRCYLFRLTMLILVKIKHFSN